MLLTIKYSAVYHYEEPVSFSPHIVRLMPRNDRFTSVKSFSLKTLKSADIQYRGDLFDNIIAYCFLPEAGSTLPFELHLEVELIERNPFHFLLESSALELPFSYPDEMATILTAYLAYQPCALPGELALKSPAPTVETLVSWNAWIHRNIEYERREEGEAFPPSETLMRGKASCRDMALLLVAVLRQHGVAARLVSGFLWEPPDSEDKRAENSLHAWVEAYLPGAGWIGLDPTNGVLADHHRISTAVGLQPKQIAPISGSYFGDHPIGSQLETSLEIQ